MRVNQEEREIAKREENWREGKELETSPKQNREGYEFTRAAQRSFGPAL